MKDRRMPNKRTTQTMVKRRVKFQKKKSGQRQKQAKKTESPEVMSVTKQKRNKS